MSVTEIMMPSNSRSRLAAAIMSTLQFASEFTDLLIHEGEPIRLKSARGVIDLPSLNLPAGDLIVNESDIKHFFASYVDGISTATRSGSYWDQVILPVLANKMAVNRAMETPAGPFLRISLFHYNRGKLAMIVRVTTKPVPLDTIGLTQQITTRLKTDPHGLLIITGPTASGKTATALSILEWINNNRAGHLTTVEDPIEWPLKANKCDITQREVGTDVVSFGEGLRDAMRIAPQAILVGEVRDRDTAESAIIGGESGALMIVTTHGRSISGTIKKMLTFTGDQSTAMREVMAGCLIGVIRQELVPRVDGSGYCLVCDTLHMTDNVRTLVEQGDWRGIDKLTNQRSMPSPDFVPMSHQLEPLVSRGIVAPTDRTIFGE